MRYIPVIFYDEEQTNIVMRSNIDRDRLKASSIIAVIEDNRTVLYRRIGRFSNDIQKFKRTKPIYL